ncbi:hypothetical protein LMH87_001638 [Akanthomyces muscarius]|uniref:WSC domain-containing protein n=1 Tax=Akanthomyces muscarius TaxID=2231603 RepID=A0A9W8Q4P4_AKAMU|nr:hypothetical protein LMH87_001638 [Akanthomyces muscarius]KAJ4147090.1 hypothetical protein LMH87_001638 [Akanthomyces muscarius]
MQLLLLNSVVWLLACVSPVLGSKEPQLSWDPNTIKDCTYWYDNTGSRTCDSIRNSWNISPETFSRWNPSVGTNCEGWRFQSYCVRVKAEETTSSPTPTSTTSSTSSTTTETAPPLWTDTGCYQDAATHPLQTRLPSPGGNDLTRAKCEAACWSAGYLYAGFKAGVECWCGKYVQGTLSPSPSDCNIACAGNSSEMCGGSNLFGIVVGRDPPYSHTTTSEPATSTSSSSASSSSSSRTSIPLPTQTAGWRVIGCYKDTADPRILKEYQYASDDTMTQDACLDRCSQRGFVYSGVENTRECWCGQKFQSTDSNTEVALSDCGGPCSGDKTQVCGAGARIYISKYDTAPIASNVGYYDNFTSGDMLPWVVSDGAYDASTKALVADAQSNVGKVLLDKSDFSDFLYELDLVLPTSPDGSNVGLVFRASNPGPGLDAYDGYLAVFGILGKVEFGRIHQGWTQMAQGTAVIRAGSTHHVAVRAIGKQLDLYIDNMTTPILSTSDTTYAHGIVGVRQFNTGATFDNIQIFPVAFWDDFSTIKALDRWQVYDGEFAVFAGLLTKTAGKALIKNTTFNDFIYEADIYPHKGRAGLLFRMDYRGNVPEGLRGFYAGVTDGIVELGRIDRYDQYIQLLAAPLDTNNTSSFHHLRVKAVGYEIYIYADDMNTPKLHVTDGSYMSGQNGIRCFEKGSLVTHIRAYTL